MTQHGKHAMACGMRFVVFMRALHRVNLPVPHAPFCTRTMLIIIYGVLIDSRNLERTNQNDGFIKMTALEC